MAREFTVHGTHGPARSGTFHLRRHPVSTPVFMPVGTQGTLKGLTSEQMEELGFEIILGNTYHLGLRPGEEVLKAVGGLHSFMAWPRNILTDSGGFQMVSLLDLAEITEEGVVFQSAHDGSTLTLTPERSIALQNAIGSDIMMQLDDVVHVLTTGSRVEEAMRRSIRWLDRCIAANSNPDQALFAIIQGGLDLDLRAQCIEEMVKRDTAGYAIGGLSGGEAKDQFWRVVAACTAALPPGKPRYCMGVGYPVDLVVCVALGVDMFDCVFPCRTARFGSALVSTGQIHLKSRAFRADFGPLDPECGCFVCRTYTRAMLHSICTREPLSAVLLTYHNLYYLKSLMDRMRKAIVQGTFAEFVVGFMAQQFPDRNYPRWVVEALHHVGITLLFPPKETPSGTAALVP
eukprot:RCo014639